jgi:hypothetical protein
LYKKHNSHLGVHVSFVRSVTMDSWSEKQVQSMRLGGNAKLIQWFKQHGIDSRAPISEKYHTDAAELYRLRLAAIRDGKPPPTELPPKKEAPPAAAPTGSDRALTGFGSQPMPQRNDPLDEISKTASDLSKTASQTFSMLAGTISTIGKDAAERLKEVKLTEKLSETGQTLSKTGEKLGETLKDPELGKKAQQAALQGWQTVSSSAMSFWKSVVDPNAPQSGNSKDNYSQMFEDDEGDFMEAPKVIKVGGDAKSTSSTTPQTKITSRPQDVDENDDDEPAVTDADEQWLQQQLSQVKAPAAIPVVAASSASATPSSSTTPPPTKPESGKKGGDDFFSEFGV